jgi:hypothetical protein
MLVVPASPPFELPASFSSDPALPPIGPAPPLDFWPPFARPPALVAPPDASLFRKSSFEPSPHANRAPPASKAALAA